MQKQLILDILAPDTPSLDNFAGNANQQTLDALRHDIGPGRAIYLYGGPGSGRTHLLHAMSRRPGHEYIDLADNGAAALQALVANETSGPTLIAIDNLHVLDDAGQAALFTLYNHWRQLGGTDHAFALVLAGSHAPRSMPLREDLRTRLGWDLVYRLHPLTDDERAMVLDSRARNLGLSLASGIIPWLLVHYSRDMGHLNALIDALNRYSLERHRPVTLPLLKELLANTHPDH